MLMVVAMRRRKHVDLREGGEEVEGRARGVRRPVVRVVVPVVVPVVVVRLGRRAGRDRLGQHLLGGAQVLW